MYYKGEGVPQDYETAVKWYTLTAKQDHVDAQFRLGAMYWSGIGVLQDYTAALKWYTLAAEQGNSNAQNNLGVMYANGRKSRDIIEKKMIAAQIGIAEEIAQKCAQNQYKDC